MKFRDFSEIPNDLNKTSIGKVFVWSTLIAFLYFSTYSYMEYLSNNTFGLWTQLLSKFVHAIGPFIPGVPKVIEQVRALGYEGRIEFIYHIWTLSYVWAYGFGILLLMQIRVIFNATKYTESYKYAVKHKFLFIMGGLFFTYASAKYFIVGDVIGEGALYPFNPHINNVSLVFAAISNIVSVLLSVMSICVCISTAYWHHIANKKN